MSAFRTAWTAGVSSATTSATQERRSGWVGPQPQESPLTLLTQQDVDVGGDAQGAVGDVLQQGGLPFAGREHTRGTLY